MRSKLAHSLLLRLLAATLLGLAFGVVAQSLVPDAAEDYYPKYHSLRLSYDLADFSLVDLQFYSKGAVFRQEEGDFLVQLVSGDGAVLYENKFSIATQVIPEPSEECFDNEGNLICTMDPFQASKVEKTVFIPSIDGEELIRIFEGDVQKLEVDLRELPLETIDIEMFESMLEPCLGSDADCDGEITAGEFIGFIAWLINSEVFARNVFEDLFNADSIQIGAADTPAGYS